MVSPHASSVQTDRFRTSNRRRVHNLPRAISVFFSSPPPRVSASNILPHARAPCTFAGYFYKRVPNVTVKATEPLGRASSAFFRHETATHSMLADAPYTNPLHQLVVKWCHDKDV